MSACVHGSAWENAEAVTSGEVTASGRVRAPTRSSRSPDQHGLQPVAVRGTVQAVSTGLMCSSVIQRIPVEQL